MLQPVCVFSGSKSRAFKHVNAAVFTLSATLEASRIIEDRMPSHALFCLGVERVPSPVVRKTRTNELASYGTISCCTLTDVDSMTNTCNSTSDIRINAAGIRNLHSHG
ncbi:MAG: hypothetical protein LBI74_09930 [Synergistaceae bacterium]|nr:hypothetical protein [Synergistaceae bacterium]